MTFKQKFFVTLLLSVFIYLSITTFFSTLTENKMLLVVVYSLFWSSFVVFGGEFLKNKIKNFLLKKKDRTYIVDPRLELLQKEIDRLNELHRLKSLILFHSLDTIQTIDRRECSDLEVKNVVKYAETLRNVYNMENIGELRIILDSIFSRKIDLNSDIEESLDKLFENHILNKRN